jgi:hypothetical protein
LIGARWGAISNGAPNRRVIRQRNRRFDLQTHGMSIAANDLRRFAIWRGA